MRSVAASTNLPLDERFGPSATKNAFDRSCSGRRREDLEVQRLVGVSVGKAWRRFRCCPYDGTVSAHVLPRLRRLPSDLSVTNCATRAKGLALPRRIKRTAHKQSVFFPLDHLVAPHLRRTCFVVYLKERCTYIDGSMSIETTSRKEGGRTMALPFKKRKKKKKIKI